MLDRILLRRTSIEKLNFSGSVHFSGKLHPPLDTEETDQYIKSQEEQEKAKKVYQKFHYKDGINVIRLLDFEQLSKKVAPEKKTDEQSIPESASSSNLTPETSPLPETSSTADSHDRKKMRRKAFWQATQVAVLVAGVVTAGVLAAVCPPVFAVVAAVAGTALSVGGPVLQRLYKLVSNLSKNEHFLPEFKKKVKEFSNEFKDYAKRKKEGLGIFSRHKSDVKLLQKLSKSIEDFSDKIQDPDCGYQQCMEESIKLEKELIQSIHDHVLAHKHANPAQKNQMKAVHQTMSQYHTLLEDVQQQSLTPEHNVRLQKILEEARQSQIAELVNWSQQVETEGILATKTAHENRTPTHASTNTRGL